MNWYPECGALMQCVEELTTMYSATKFFKIISTDCFPNYPDCNIPTMLVYNNGVVKANYVRLHTFGSRCTPGGVAMILCHSDSILHDGLNGKASREAVPEAVRKRFIEMHSRRCCFLNVLC